MAKGEAEVALWKGNVALVRVEEALGNARAPLREGNVALGEAKSPLPVRGRQRAGAASLSR